MDKPHVSEVNRAKTVCAHGHSLEGAYITPQGWRVCKSCRRQRDRERKRLDAREVDLSISKPVVTPQDPVAAGKAKLAALLERAAKPVSKPVETIPEEYTRETVDDGW